MESLDFLRDLPTPSGWNREQRTVEDVSDGRLEELELQGLSELSLNSCLS